MKRFTETNKWDDPWFRKISPVAKCLWSYLVDKCDCIGLIDLDLEDAAFRIGTKVNDQHLTELDSRLQRLKSGKIFIPKFIHFQYGKLSEECRAHIPVLKAMEFHGLTTSDGIAYQYPIDRVSIPMGIPTSTGTGQEKEKGGAGGKHGFTKPDMPSMELYAAKIGLPPTEINKFYDYYESNGWRVGRNPMKSWEAAMRNWKNNLQTYGTKTRINGAQVNKRNHGVIDNGTDYGAAARAKLARQTKMARPVDGNDTAPP